MGKSLSDSSPWWWGWCCCLPLFFWCELLKAPRSMMGWKKREIWNFFEMIFLIYGSENSNLGKDLILFLLFKKWFYFHKKRFFGKGLLLLWLLLPMENCTYLGYVASIIVVHLLLVDCTLSDALPLVLNPPLTIPWGSTMHFLIHFKTHLLNKINGIYGREGRVVKSGEIETRKSVHQKVWFGSGLPSGPVGLKCLKSHLKSSHLKTGAREPWPQKTLPSLP